MKTKLTAIPMIAAGLAATMVLSGCGSSTTNGSSAAPTASASTSANTTSPAQNVSGQKVSANTAGEAEITAALQAAGVANAQRWTREVLEYRPYDASDANLTKLQQNLAKYNPGQDTINKIVGALQP